MSPPSSEGSYLGPQRPPGDTTGWMGMAMAVLSAFHSRGCARKGESAAGDDKGLGIL